MYKILHILIFWGIGNICYAQKVSVVNFFNPKLKVSYHNQKIFKNNIVNQLYILDSNLNTSAEIVLIPFGFNGNQGELLQKGVFYSFTVKDTSIASFCFLLKSKISNVIIDTFRFVSENYTFSFKPDYDEVYRSGRIDKISSFMVTPDMVCKVNKISIIDYVVRLVRSDKIIYEKKVKNKNIQPVIKKHLNSRISSADNTIVVYSFTIIVNGKKMFCADSNWRISLR